MAEHHLSCPSRLSSQVLQGKGNQGKPGGHFLVHFLAMEDGKPQNSPCVARAVSSRQKETQESTPCLAKEDVTCKVLKVSEREEPGISQLGPSHDQAGSSLPAATQNRSPVAQSSASLAAVPEQGTGRKRSRKTKHLVDVKAATCERSAPASSSASSGDVGKLRTSRKRKQNIWTVDSMEGTKLRLNKKRRPSYRPEDQEAFYRLLEDPIIQSFLAADVFLKVSDKYLLSMVVEYFGRVGLPGHLYNRIHFFLALYIASDMEEDNLISKQSIFQFLLGKEHWLALYKDFLKLRMEFFQAMGYRAWVTLEMCEEIQAQNPHHWVWSRERQRAP
ncbi:uncharacterized protein LOC103255874 [Carlito syrichta]|uniref:Uncharacterized protein LOC103255874 n=1 Tax=Carlito syrichta TaxID=1868482 RepID=A0A3Q0DSC7_CARSF|nr:uncharacterized protein LOC103255874 [Carlito syrichta]